MIERPVMILEHVESPLNYLLLVVVKNEKLISKKMVHPGEAMAYLTFSKNEQWHIRSKSGDDGILDIRFFAPKRWHINRLSVN